VYDFLQTNQPWKQYLQGGNFTLMPALVPGQKLQLSGTLSATPAAVPHRAEFSDAVGFYVQVSDTVTVTVTWSRPTHLDTPERSQQGSWGISFKVLINIQYNTTNVRALP
jgi:hypothetical protein